MRYLIGTCGVLMLLAVGGCSVKRNNFFSRNYHQLTTRYNVYFNGNQALKAGEKRMAEKHKEDYTTLLPVFVSNVPQTRSLCSSDMDYAAEKAVKAIDKHSITAKPRRRKNKDSKSYQEFRTKKEFNNQLDRCYLLLGKSYFYKQKYGMANNTFRFVQRQYPKDEKIQTEAGIWLFRSLTEMGRYDEAAQVGELVKGMELNRRQRELMNAVQTDYYVRQDMFKTAIPEAERLLNECRNWRRKSRYRFMLSQLYLKEGQDAEAMDALKRTVRFNFNHELVFNAKINMALASNQGDREVEKQLSRMLRDSRNKDYQDRIYYALGNIEEKRGDDRKAVDMYWKSVRSTVDNENQQALSFRKLGDHYFKEKDYLQAQSCYDSCMYAMDSRTEGYEQLKSLLTDLTELAANLRTIQLQDSLLQLASLPDEERNKVIDSKIQAIKDQEEEARELERRQQTERNFYDRNNMINRGNLGQEVSGGDWYFYNPMTIALGKNEFKRKWGRRKAEDHWRRQNKSMVEFTVEEGELSEVVGEDEQKKDVKSRDYYLQDIPLTEESKGVSEKKLEEAYYKAGELYQYKFNDPEKALECFDAYIRRFTTTNNLPMVYYLAYSAAEKMGKNSLAAEYKQGLQSRFPESDFARALNDPNYFKQVEDVLKRVDGMYQKAYVLYEQVYYREALQICNEILSNYPDNKLKSNVLFLRAMCVLNSGSQEEGRVAVEEVLKEPLLPEMRGVLEGVLRNMSTGEKAVVYSDADMAMVRDLRSSRNWKFDEEVLTGKTKKEETTFQLDKDKEQQVVLFMPEDLSLAEELRFKARMTFIHAAEAAEGKTYEMKKEEIWYKKNAFFVSKFENAKEATDYLNRIARDKYLLKIIGNRSYRMFSIGTENLAVLKRVKDADQYVSFFAENYFEDQRQGEIVAGKWGATGHLFNREEGGVHHFVLAVPFREVNTKRLAELLKEIDPAYTLMKENYGNGIELIVVRNVGEESHGLEYMNQVLKNKELFDHLAGVEYENFIISEANLRAMIENESLDGYVHYFNENYMKAVGSVGIEDGDYVYNKSVPHRFVLFYPNSVDPFKLKTIFEELNFSGLTLNNQKFDAENDYMLVSGFNNKEEAMRYFKSILSDRKLAKMLRGVEYTNFVVTEVNMQVLAEKKNLENYLEFFKKYYLN